MDWREDLDDPTKVSVVDHYRNVLPVWLVQFLDYVLGLEFEAEPDYDFLKNLLATRLNHRDEREAAEFCGTVVDRHFRRAEAAEAKKSVI